MEFGHPFVAPRPRIFYDWPKDVGNTIPRNVEIYSFIDPASLSRCLESSASTLLWDISQSYLKFNCLKESQWPFRLIWRALNKALFEGKISVVEGDSICHCEKEFIRKCVLTIIGYGNKTMTKALWIILKKDKLLAVNLMFKWQICYSSQ
jgi:hypothetical protein